MPFAAAPAAPAAPIAGAPSPESRQVRAALYLLLLVTYLAFSPTLESEFVNYDDNLMVTENPAITSLSPASVARMFSSSHRYLYHPLVTLSYAVEYRFWGLDPFVYHLTNLLLHLGCTLLAFLLILRLEQRIFPALVAGLLFGVHPLRVESVAWVTERKDVLYALFYLAGLVSYTAWQRTPRRGLWLATHGWFLLSLLAKPMAITFPLALLLLDYRARRPYQWRRKLPAFALAALFLVIAFAGHFPAGVKAKHPDFAWGDGPINAGYGLLFYLDKLAAPVRLACIYATPGVSTTFIRFDPRWAPLVAALLLAAALRLARLDRRIGFGVGFFVVSLLPVLHLLPVGGAQLPADRYTYLAALGLFSLGGCGLARLYDWPGARPRLVRGAVVTALALLVLILAGLTGERCLVWRNSFTLWNDMLEQFPDAAIAWNGRGHALFTAGQLELALDDYDRALAIAPRYAQAYNNRGVARGMLGRLDEAVADLTTVVELAPGNPDGWQNLGSAYLHRKMYGAAIAAFNTAKNLAPADPRSDAGLGLVHLAAGDTAAAQAAFAAALARQPDLVIARNGRAGLLLRLGDYAGARRDYAAVLAVDPVNPEARGGLGLASFLAGDLNRALDEFNWLVACYPGSAEGYRNRAAVLAARGDTLAAQSDLDQARRLSE